MRSLVALGALAIPAAAASASIIPVSSYYYEIQPYAYLDSGNEMIDGQWSTTGINPIEPWVAWSSAHSKTVFDLGSSQAIGSSMLIFCHWGGAAVYLPTSVTFELSNAPDFTGSTTLTFTTPEDWSHGGVTVQKDYDLSAAPASRYVRVSADGNFTWLFIGETQFNTVPTPAPVGLLAAAGLAMARRRRR